MRQSPERLAAWQLLCRLLRGGPDHALPPHDDAIWPQVMALVDQNLVAPQLYRALQSQGVLQRVPDDMQWVLQETWRLTQLHCQALRRQMLHLSQALTQAGICPVWLKGAALLLEPDWPARVRLMSDLDVWVPQPGQQQQALHILQRLGYQSKPVADVEVWNASHHYAPLFHPQQVATLELHRHVVRRRLADMLDDEHARRQLQRLDWQGVPVARLSLDLRIVHSLIQCTLMSTPSLASGQIRLMKVMDFLALLDEAGYATLPPHLAEPLAHGGRRRAMSRFFTLLQRDFALANPFDHDPAWCQAVDHLLLYNRLPWRAVVSEALVRPENWGYLLRRPWLWPVKLLARLRLGHSVRRVRWRGPYT